MQKVKLTGKATVALLGVCLVPLHVLGQMLLHGTNPLPTFDVVTIKPGDAHSPMPTQDEEFFAGPIRRLVASAYNIPTSNRIIGMPKWLSDEPYTIAMKIDGTDAAEMQKMMTVKRDERIHLMEQSLLADRFKLKGHFEMRDMQVYKLVVAKNKPKLTPSQDEATGVEQTNVSLKELKRGMMIRPAPGSAPTSYFKGYSLQDLSDFLTKDPELDGRSVINNTGLTGTYDFQLTMSWGVHDSPESVSAFSAVQDDLGLKLVPGNAPVEVLVIDSIQRPSDN